MSDAPQNDDPNNDDPNSDPQARSRFIALSIFRLTGAIMVMLGLLVINGNIAWPPMAGYALMVLGIFEFYVFPRILVRKWRSPRE